MQRHLKIFTLLLVTLFLLMAGLNSVLDRQSRETKQSSFVWYNEKGEVILAYEGDLNLCQAYVKPLTATPPASLHRTSSSGDAPVSSGSEYRWF
jgi:hypothetical protein